MSAFLVTDKHVRYLANAATSRVIDCHGGGLHWHDGNKSRNLRPGDRTEWLRVVNMLWQANAESVRARYDDDTDAPIIEDYTPLEPGPLVARDTPAQILKACDGLEYQSCEYAGWKDSEAKRFLDALRANAWRRVPGYDEARWAI